MDVKSLLPKIHTTLRNMPRYKKLDRVGASELGDDLKGIPLEGEQILIGVYENDPNNIHDNIFISNQGLLIFVDSHWKFANFEKITKIHTPESVYALSLKIEVNEDVIYCTFRPRDDGFNDLFEFMRFLLKTCGSARVVPPKTEQYG